MWKSHFVGDEEGVAGDQFLQVLAPVDLSQKLGIAVIAFGDELEQRGIGHLGELGLLLGFAGDVAHAEQVRVRDRVSGVDRFDAVEGKRRPVFELRRDGQPVGFLIASERLEGEFLGASVDLPRPEVFLVEEDLEPHGQFAVADGFGLGDAGFFLGSGSRRGVNRSRGGRNDSRRNRRRHGGLLS